MVITRTEIGAVSHAGERVVKANRSIQKSVRFPMQVRNFEGEQIDTEIGAVVEC